MKLSDMIPITEYLTVISILALIQTSHKHFCDGQTTSVSLPHLSNNNTASSSVESEVSSLNESSNNSISPYKLPIDLCPSLSSSAVVVEGYRLNEDKNYGTSKFLGSVGGIPECASLCCKDISCDLALFTTNNCTGVKCDSPSSCMPLSDTENKALILLRNLPQPLYVNSEFSDSNLSNTVPLSKKKDGGDPSVGGNSNVSLLNVDKTCEVNLNQCDEREICQPFGDKRRDGVCVCREGYTRNNVSGYCDEQSIDQLSSEEPSVISNGNFPSPDHSASSSTTVSSTVSAIKISTTVAVPKNLDVTVNNKTVTLPKGKEIYEQKVTLSAYVLGECKTCLYEWKVLEQPHRNAEETAGSVTDSQSQTITLTNLVAGVYLFAVQVTKPSNVSDGAILAIGSTVAALSVVLPPQSNKPPQAFIVPPKQTVTLPNSAVILDGSSSVDDFSENSKLEYKWELVMKPLEYNLEKQTGQTLKLQNLVPGNYTIMLRVKDEGGLEGNATAIVEVVQEKDYPPSANAGGDQIVYLPTTTAVMDGSASSDDHGIVEWEWTKGPDDDGRAVDMQDTRKPKLKLSGLEEGHYQFVLTVADNSGQMDKSVANVYVHRADAAELKAVAGPDISLTLPTSSVILNAKNSTGNTPDTECLWTQVTGPTSAVFLPSPKNITVNVTGLTRGVYTFQFMLASDIAKKVSNDSVTVTVKQEVNRPPKANGGGDFSVTLPVSLVQVNGSASSDDVAIVKWVWERLPNSLAAGHILGRSDSSPVLLLTGLVTGQYKWKLSVYDDQGLSNSDTVSFFVKPSSHQKDHVAIVLGAGIESVSSSQMTNLVQALKLMLPSTISLEVVDFNGLSFTGESNVIVLGHDNKNELRNSRVEASKDKIVPGVELASMLKVGVRTASSGATPLLNLPIVSIHTVICHNKCSGHGECDQFRRECVCQSWWMESFIRRKFGDYEPNCDWSVVYVFVSSFALTSFFVLAVWGVATLLTRKKDRRPKRVTPSVNSNGGLESWWIFGSCTCCGKQNRVNGKRRIGRGRYSLLDEDGIKSRTRNALLESASESGSDTDVLFDSRSSLTKRHKLLLPEKHKNGHVKLQMSQMRT